MRAPRAWGVRPEEIAAHYPCDDLVHGPAESWFRAVSVRARGAEVYRWLCQLRVAPYSYDLLDNAGRRSPRRLTPGVDELATGQRFMTIFRLEGFSPLDHVTLRIDDPAARRMFGDIALSYVVRDLAGPTSRIVVKLLVSRTGGRPAAIRRYVLGWGDLLMMRRQLTTLRDLAERSEEGRGPEPVRRRRW